MVRRCVAEAGMTCEGRAWAKSAVGPSSPVPRYFSHPPGCGWTKCSSGAVRLSSNTLGTPAASRCWVAARPECAAPTTTHPLLDPRCCS